MLLCKFEAATAQKPEQSIACSLGPQLAAMGKDPSTNGQREEGGPVHTGRAPHPGSKQMRMCALKPLAKAKLHGLHIACSCSIIWGSRKSNWRGRLPAKRWACSITPCMRLQQRLSVLVSTTVGHTAGESPVTPVKEAHQIGTKHSTAFCPHQDAPATLRNSPITSALAMRPLSDKLTRARVIGKFRQKVKLQNLHGRALQLASQWQSETLRI